MKPFYNNKICLIMDIVILKIFLRHTREKDNVLEAGTFTFLNDWT